MTYPDDITEIDPVPGGEPNPMWYRIADWLGTRTTPTSGTVAYTLSHPTAGHNHDGATSTVVSSLAVAQSMVSTVISTVTHSNTTSRFAAVNYTMASADMTVGTTLEFWIIGNAVNNSAGTVNYTFDLAVAGTAALSFVSGLLAASTRVYWVHGVLTIRTLGSSGTAAAALFWQNDAGGSDVKVGTLSLNTTGSLVFDIGVTMDTAISTASWNVYLGTIRPGKS